MSDPDEDILSEEEEMKSIQMDRAYDLYLGMLVVSSLKSLSGSTLPSNHMAIMMEAIARLTGEKISSINNLASAEFRDLVRDIVSKTAIEANKLLSHTSMQITPMIVGNPKMAG